MTSPSAAVVSQRLCNLLMSFPEAAIAGVEWQALARKYKERHAQQLDLHALGHSSALAAASTLLWDVLRIANSDDTDNPIVALEDHVALTAQPGLLGCWPSLYKALCEVSLEHGAAENGAAARGLLMSQLKPLLEKQWHTSFEENGLGYLTAKGSFVKLKKMKHLVQAVISWRGQRVAWRLEDARAQTAIDEALAPSLELVASTRHNDLVLRCTPAGPQDFQEPVPAPAGAPAAPGAQVQQARAPAAARGAVCHAGQPCHTGEARRRGSPAARAAGGRPRRTPWSRRWRCCGRRTRRCAGSCRSGPRRRSGRCRAAPSARRPRLGEARRARLRRPLRAAAGGGPLEGVLPLGRGWLARAQLQHQLRGRPRPRLGERQQRLRRRQRLRRVRRHAPVLGALQVGLPGLRGSLGRYDAAGGLRERGGSQAPAGFLPVAMWWTMVPPTARGALLQIPCGIVQSMRAHFEPGAGAQ
ncbi:unnamed protein product [Prorocentrum cordatum]|uniref:Uncharacterized protein n=1 Tax=Prorocentrum cordatum TaxID=2364126 RepID=A0ABN9RTN1_9DINO|nr:unnamed protein product [Polarella glacialis]